jgi:hypothetical protein
MYIVVGLLGVIFTVFGVASLGLRVWLASVGSFPEPSATPGFTLGLGIVFLFLAFRSYRARHRV